MKAKLVKESLNEYGWHHISETLPRGIEPNPNDVRDILEDEPNFFGGLEKKFPEILDMKTMDEHDQYDSQVFHDWSDTVLQDREIHNFSEEAEGEYGPVFYSPDEKIGFVEVRESHSGDYIMYFFR